MGLSPLMFLKRLIPRFIVCLVLLFTFSQWTEAATPLRVVTWNIQFGQGTDGVTNYDRIATWLARMNADVIALCEVPPDQIPTLVDLLTQKTGRTWNSHFVPKAPGISEGNLILSTYSFVSTGSHYLSYTRSIAQVTINVGGRNINFFATHLDHTSSALRDTEAAELLAWTAGFPTPQIVAGDMNAGNDAPEVLRLLNVYRDGWVDALNLGSAFAYPDNPVAPNTRTRRWRIDFILYSGDPTSFVVRRSEIPDLRDLSNSNVVIALGTLDDRGVRPSDHNLVVTDFDVAGSGNPTPTPNPTPSPTPTPTPVPAPVLLTQPTTGHAIALHSTLFTGEPFEVTSPLNLSSDLRTRIMLFATGLDLLPGETISAVSARGTDPRGFTYELPVEDVIRLPNFNFLTTVVVRLPDDPTINGDVSVTISIHGVASNAARITFRAR